MILPFKDTLVEYEYGILLRKLVYEAEARTDRTGVGTRGLFGCNMSLDISEQFPLLTRKKMPFRQMVEELRWFISGSTNYLDLDEKTQHWWSPWADEDGELGPVYGKQLRDSGGVDQLRRFVDGIVNDPYSRRHIISLWNASQLWEMRLPPCHGLVIQGYVSNDDRLSIKMYQRSADFFIGEPVNIASYALFTYLVAAVTNTKPHMLHLTLGDVHLYENHIDAAKEFLNRQYIPAPRLEVSERLIGAGLEGLTSFTRDDVKLIDYNPAPPISAPLAV